MGGARRCHRRRPELPRADAHQGPFVTIDQPRAAGRDFERSAFGNIHVSQLDALHDRMAAIGVDDLRPDDKIAVDPKLLMNSRRERIQCLSFKSEV